MANVSISKWAIESGCKEYRAWRSMRHRCYSPIDDSFYRYGAIGITVCDRWQQSYRDFLDDMGRAPSKKYSLDRIDNTKGYSPDNCKWSDPIEQQNNRSNNALIRYKDRTQTLIQWIRELNLDEGLIAGRRHSGWSVEDMFEKPKRFRNPNGQALPRSVIKKRSNEKKRMKYLTLFFLLVATSCFAQTHDVIISKGKFNVKTAIDIPLKPGTTGQIDLRDTSKVFMFQVADPTVTTLYYSTTPPTTPPNPTPGTITVEAESFVSSTNTEKIADGNRQIIRPQNGGLVWTVTYNTFTVTSQKTITFTYANGTGAAIPVTVTVGTTNSTINLPPSANWGTYITSPGTITGSGQVKMSFPKGLNLDGFIIR